jgi:hypothetical protein
VFRISLPDANITDRISVNGHIHGHRQRADAGVIVSWGVYWKSEPDLQSWELGGIKQRVCAGELSFSNAGDRVWVHRNI